MSASLVELVARLEQQAVQRDGVPASYHALVREAIEQFSQDAPPIRHATLSIVANTAAYDLPADFQFVIGLSMEAVQGDVLVTAGGLVPMSPFKAVRPRYYVQGDQIVFDPAPTYATTWTLRYAGRYVESAGVYTDLPAGAARVALLYAAYLALNEQALAVGGEAWSYTIGAETIDRKGVAGSVRTAADGALTTYKDALRAWKGSGMLGGAL